MTDTITVIKRDGSLEPFVSQKVSKVLVAAGLTADQAEIISQRVQNWISENNLQMFKSLELRDQILTPLEIINPQVADLYKWYESTKDQPSQQQ
jgi:2-phosphoglycerate kinase